MSHARPMSFCDPEPKPKPPPKDHYKENPEAYLAGWNEAMKVAHDAFDFDEPPAPDAEADYHGEGDR